MSPTWSDATKRWVVTAGAVLLIGLLYFVRNQIPLVALAVILAFLVNPVVDFLTYQGRLPRRLAAALVYLALVSLIILPFFFVPNLIGRIAALIPDAATIRALVIDLVNRLSSIETLQIGPNLAAALQAPLDRFGEVLRSASGAGLSFLGRLTVGLASRLVDLIFILVVSLYLVMDTPRIFAYLASLVPPGYEHDAENLGREINDVWGAFSEASWCCAWRLGLSRARRCGCWACTMPSGWASWPASWRLCLISVRSWPPSPLSCWRCSRGQRASTSTMSGSRCWSP